jgi:hypothetical protein
MSDLIAIVRGKRSDRSFNEPNGRGDTVAQANDLPSPFVQARRCRELTTEQQ